MSQFQYPLSGNADNASGKPQKDVQQIALLKSLEYLYVEACYAKMALVATLIGAAIEAVKDELAPANGVARSFSPSVTISVRNISANRLLTDDEDIDDEDFMEE
jgi:hypothetical protein